MNPGAYHGTTFANGPKPANDERADRRENDRGIQRMRGRGIRVADPGCAQLVRECLGLFISGAIYWLWMRGSMQRTA